MDQLIFASLSHTHYWYEVGMLKYRRNYVCTYDHTYSNDDTTAMTIPLLLLQYVARFDGGGEIVGFGGGDHKKSRPWCSLFVSSTHRTRIL